jgi:anti-anti-sigma regulatory factor
MSRMAHAHAQVVAHFRPAPDTTDRLLAWAGGVTWRETTQLRELLFDALEVEGFTGVRLDVSGVLVIDQTGIGLLIGANHRAAATGRRFILIDSGGPVTAALQRMHLIRDFTITQLVAAEHFPVAAAN